MMPSTAAHVVAHVLLVIDCPDDHVVASGPCRTKRLLYDCCSMTMKSALTLGTPPKLIGTMKPTTSWGRRRFSSSTTSRLSVW